MNLPIPILADIGDVVGLIVFVVIMLLGAAGQIINKAKEAQEKAAGRPPARPRQVGPGQPPQRPPQRPQQGPLADEIGEFVRRASQRRAGGGAGGGPQAPARPARQAPHPAAAGPIVRPLSAEVPVDVELLEPLAEEGSVAQHVRSHVGSEEIGSLTARRIASQVESADEKVDRRIHQVFDRKLGRLSETPAESATAVFQGAEMAGDRSRSLPLTVAAGPAAMFANAANIRQAILIHEILQRPLHRWS